MEIAAGDDLVLVRKDDRIVRNRVNFPRNSTIYISNRISGRAVDLRQTALGIRVLYLCIVQRQRVLRTLQQSSHILRRVHLPLMPSKKMGFWIIGLGNGMQRLTGQCACDIRNLHQVYRIVQRIQTDGCQHLRTVVERQPLFGCQHHRRQVCLRERILCLNHFAFILYLA